MRTGRRLLIAGFAAASLGADWSWLQPLGPVSLLICEGSFGRFANGTLVEKPDRLRFIVDWQAPWVQTEAGRGGRIILLDSAKLDFEMLYDGYRALYQVNRVDGTIRQTVNLGASFTGTCALRPYQTRF